MEIYYVLDINSGETNLLAGYIFDNTPVIIDSLSALVKDQIKHGRINDIDESAEVVKKLVAQMEKNLKRKIENIIISLPPFGLQVFEAQKGTNIISQQGIIGEIDINNLQNLFRKETIEGSFEQIAIVPLQFEIDGPNYLTEPPLGEISNQIDLIANVHFIDKIIYEDYLAIIKKCKLKLSKSLINVHALSEIVNAVHQKDTYLLINFEHYLTSIAFVGEGRLFGATHFDQGSSHLIDYIITNLHIEEKEAQRILDLFGYEGRPIYFDGVIAYLDEGDQKVEITQSSLNRVISEFFVLWYQEVQRYIELLKKDIVRDADWSRLPHLLTGNGFAMNGFQDIYEQLGFHQPYEITKFNVLGARYPNYTTGLGLIYCAHKYRAFKDDREISVGNVQRVATNNKRRLYSESEDDL